MFAINPENERIRAEAILRSFTEYDEAVDLFAPTDDSDQVETVAHTAKTEGIIRIFKAKLHRQPSAEKPDQQPAYVRPHTTACCS